MLVSIWITKEVYEIHEFVVNQTDPDQAKQDACEQLRAIRPRDNYRITSLEIHEQ